MYAITGVTGKVGGVVAKTLLSSNQQVRAVLRDTGKASTWSELGCEIGVANMEDPVLRFPHVSSSRISSLPLG